MGHIKIYISFSLLCAVTLFCVREQHVALKKDASNPDQPAGNGQY